MRPLQLQVQKFQNFSSKLLIGPIGPTGHIFKPDFKCGLGEHNPHSLARVILDISARLCHGWIRCSGGDL